jgi:hypothetical protein
MRDLDFRTNLTDVLITDDEIYKIGLSKLLSVNCTLPNDSALCEHTTGQGFSNSSVDVTLI